MMRHWIPALMLIPVAGMAHANDKRCLISFDSATLNVCTSEVKVVSEVLRPLANVSSFASSPLRVVKFDAPIHADQRADLERAGAEVLGYAPHHAYLVRMNPAIDPMVSAIRGVLWTGPYLPIWKLDVNLARDIGNEGNRDKIPSLIDEAGIRRLTVALHPDANAVSARSALLAVPGIEVLSSEKGPDHERFIVGFERAQLADAVRVLATQPEVASISLRWDNEFMNSQAGWLHQSGVSDSLPIFEQGIFGCGQIVGAADSGLFATHCSFSDTTFGQPVTSVCADGSNCAPVAPNFEHRKIGAHYKWDGSSGAPADGQGHGTHVMGSLTGNNPAGAVDCENLTTPGGLTDLDGTAPGAKLISQEMGASLQYVNSLGGTIYHASTTAFENGARIHNNSWGSSCRSQGVCIADCQVEYRQTSRDADRAVWDFPELAIFVAAGNSGGLGGSAGCGPGADVGSGGNAKNVFSIGSNNRGTGGDSMSGFSSRGPTQDRRSKPDLTAQGSSIVSAQRDACGTRVSSGTSMATPTAAGLAALAREYLNRGFYPSGIENAGHAIPTPSAALLKALLITGAQEINGSGTTGGVPSQSQGWGRLHLDNALYFDGDARNLWLHDGTAGLQTDAVDNHQIVAESGEPLIVTLAWHDFPALVNANPHTVNLLRLEVETPAGEVWTQKLSAGGGLTDPNPFQAITTVDYDDRNNVHQIRFDAPVTGPYQIRVRGIAVAEGPQPYALAATGKLLGLTEPDFLLQVAQPSQAFCAGENVSFNVGVFSFEGFVDPVSLSSSALPGGATGAFQPNPVTPAAPAAISVLSISNTAGIAAGTHVVTLTGESDGSNFPVVTKTRDISLQVDAEAPVAGDLLLPADAATQQSLRPAFSWAPFDGASAYRLEVATDAAFTDIVIDQEVEGTSFATPTSLNADSTYFWRVSASNQCGSGTASEVFSFTTSDLICSEPALAIPDNTPAGVSDVLTVAEGGLIGDLRVSLDLTHTFIGDLQVTLTKGSTTIPLVNRPTSCSGNDIDVFVDDAATLTMQGNCLSGTDPAPAYIDGESYRPATPLAGFDGADFSGDWTLRVADNANVDVGTLNRWCLLPTLTVNPHIFAHGFEADAPTR
jgi:subtilisin-like proprotein convertase family protein